MRTHGDFTLARIDGALENAFIEASIADEHWIAANDKSQEGTWRWATAASLDGDVFWSGDDDGSPVGGLYSNWSSHQPNDLLGQDCASIDDDGGRWNDEDCARTNDYVCEATTSCADGVLNGDETDVDCGGSCPPCDAGETCSTNADCGSFQCDSGTCAPATCSDRIRNGDESDRDCGGSCLGCEEGEACATDGDCAVGRCANGACTSCGDGLTNGTESDVDCGGACGPCPFDTACRRDFDCQTGTCFQGRCGRVPCGNPGGLQTAFASAMWGVCPTRVRFSQWSVSRTPPAASWTFNTSGNVRSTPAVTLDGKVFFGSNDNRLYALDPDGQKLWHFSTGGNVETSPAIGIDGTIYFGAHNGKVFAVRRDGTQKWAYDTGLGPVRSSPVIGADGTVFIGSDSDKLYALDPENGQPRWSTNLGGRDVASSPALSLDGQTVYAGSDSNDLWALRSSDGTVKWKFSTNGDVKSTPTVAIDGSIVFGSDDNRVYSVRDAGDHAEEIWRFTTGDDVRSSAAVLPGFVAVIGSDDEKLYILRLEPGLRETQRKVAAVVTTGAIRSAPIITSDAHIVFTSEDGKVRLTDLGGTVVWGISRLEGAFERRP